MGSLCEVITAIEAALPEAWLSRGSGDYAGVAVAPRQHHQCNHIDLSTSRLLARCAFCVSSLPAGVLWECELREGYPTATAAPTIRITCTVLLGRRD